MDKKELLKELCPICGKGKLIKKVSDEILNYRGGKIIVLNYTTYLCSVCEEEIVDDETVERVGNILKEGNKTDERY